MSIYTFFVLQPYAFLAHNIHIIDINNSEYNRGIPKTEKMVLILPCLTLSIIKYISRVKWTYRGKWLTPSPTPWCSSYRKGSLRVTLDYGRQLYLLSIYKFYYYYLSGYFYCFASLSKARWFLYSNLFFLDKYKIYCIRRIVSGGDISDYV